MTLKISVGYGTKLIEAKERAIYFYNEVEGQKTFLSVETERGYNEIQEQVWVTTIWFNHYEPVQEQEQKFEYIGSTMVDPNDPDWREKWNTALEADT